MRLAIFLLALVLLAAAPGWADEVRGEIHSRVIERCAHATVAYRAHLRYQLSGRQLSRASAARMAHSLIRSESSARLVERMHETVRGRNSAERERLYDIAYVNCFLAGAE